MSLPADPMQVPVDASRVIAILQGRLSAETARSAALEAQLQQVAEREAGLVAQVQQLQAELQAARFGLPEDRAPASGPG